MKNVLRKVFAALRYRKPSEQSWKRCRSAIAIVLVFVTTYAMVMPAIALEGEKVSDFAGLDLANRAAGGLNCHFDVHKHTKECYKEVPVYDADGRQTGTNKVLHCGKEDWVVHEHDENCYQDGKLVCELPEHKEHKHDAKCYTTQRVLSCPKEEKQGHKHTDACFEEIKELACGQEEHVHTEACYAEREDNGENTEPQLICGQEEHVHSDECYNTEKKLICGKEEEEGHTHTDACYTEKEVLICKELMPHTHDLDCYEKGPDGESAAEMGWVQLKDENDPNCKEVVYGDPDHLICGKTELLVHQHGEECFGEAEDDVNTEELHSDAEEAEPQDDTAIEDLQIVTDDGAETESETDNVTDAEAEGETGEEDASLIKLHSENEGESEDSDSSEDAQDKQDINTRTVEVDGASYSLVITYPTESNIPENAEFRATAIADTRTDYEAYRDRAFAAVDSYNAESEERSRAQEMPGLFDLTIFDEEGNEIQPDAPLQISIDLGTKSEAEAEENVEKPAGIFAVHFPGTGVDTVMKPAATNPVEMAAQKVAERIAGTGPEVIETADGEDGTVQFEAESLSVYAIVYTVDFHWEVDGKEYSFSIPGGGFVSLQKLVEILGITDKDAKELSEDDSAEMQDADDAEEAESSQKKEATALTLDGVQISEETKKFIADVEKVEFSNPDLIWVGKVDEETTVGALKETNGLDVEHSEELTKKQIKEINAQTVEGGDWALISLKSFLSDEMLTVTMKEGEVFTIHVTDALHVPPDELVGKEIIIYDKTENRALTSDWEQNSYRTQFGSMEYGGEGSETSENTHWKVEKNNGKYYLKSHDGKYLQINNTNVSLVDTWNYATALTIEEGGNPDYRIYAQGTSNYLTYSENNEHPGIFAAPGALGGTGNTRTWLGIDYATPIPDPVGDWLLYFDDDFSEITIHVGETISLRPYDKWQWKENNADVQSAHWNIGGKDNNFWNQIDSSDSNGAHRSRWDDGGDATNSAKFHWTAYVKKDTELETHYWSVQGRATQTGVYYLTNTKNNKTIKVNVVDGDPVNKPQTINGTVDIAVNLFDYDRFYVLDPTDNSNLANGILNKAINYNGKPLYFMSSGGGDAGNPDSSHINRYTKGVANKGIVNNVLNTDGYPQLSRDSGNSGNLKYLFDISQKSWTGGTNNDGMIAYPNVNGMFQKDSNGYYYYNSNTNYFYYDSSSKEAKLYEHTYTQASSKDKGSLVNDKPIGFFPFHDYDATKDLYVNQNHALNHHLGMSMEIPFKMKDGKKDERGNDIKFEFTGDDDLWVFAEWVDNQGKKQSKLLLDIGGIHQPVYGYIDFTNDKSSSLNSLGLQPNVDYKLKVYYLERGGCDSNLAIRFNLPLTNIGDIAFTKKDLQTGDPLPGAKFGLYSKDSCEDKYLVRVATSDSSGHVLFNDVSVGTYYLREINPPPGYVRSTYTYTVEVKAKNNGEVTLITDNQGNKQVPNDYSYIVNNAPIQLHVKKVWLQDQNTDKPAEVYFKLYKKGSPDTEITDKTGYVTGKGYALNANNGWAIDFRGLADGEYYVVEETLQNYITMYAAKDVSTNVNPDTDPDIKNSPSEAMAEKNGNLTILNKPKIGSLMLTKVLTVNDHEPRIDEEKSLTNGTYEFTVTGVNGTATERISHTIKITFANGIATKYQIDTGDEQSVSATDNKYSVVLRNLIAGDYTITETAPTNGMILKTVTGGKSVDSATKVATVTVTAGDMTPDQNTAKVVFVNNCALYEVVIVKVDTASTTTKLGGAEFDLYASSSVEEKDGKIVVKEGEQPLNSNKLVSSAEEGENKGKVSLGKLEAGTYYLFETKAPAGYYQMDMPVSISVSDSRVALTQGNRVQEGTIIEQGEKTELMVMNSSGVELPHTGGPGTKAIYLTGLLLIVIAGLGWIMRRRGSYSR